MFKSLARMVGRSLARAPGQIGRELARQGRMGSYELGAALFSQSNAYRGDLGLHGVHQADPIARSKARAASACQRQPERGMERG